ncbi:lipase secretion chaperone [Marinobacter sp.]|uniref:lipase secretion chaperone n=1 Tax=Marinobacter sp. TaxID=50741 RepID=UPI00299DC698|nr:lipase secretion chaperone [Marinobacter sp.]
MPAVVSEAPVTVPAKPPASLAGTEVPAGWQVLDANGHLVATPELRALFEYYLAALGEESLAQLVTRIRSALAVLPEPARSQARETLARYLDYKLAVSELEDAAGAGAIADDPEVWLQRLRDLRRSHLGGATAEAFFAADEAVDRFQLERRRILAAEGLEEAERQRLLARAEAALPEPLRQARAEASRFSDYQQARSELADDPAALQAYRESEFGVEAAAALARVEQEQADWERRWQAYRKAVSALDTSGLAPPEQAAARQRLRSEHFQGAERVRAEALDSLQ